MSLTKWDLALLDVGFDCVQRLEGTFETGGFSLFFPVLLRCRSQDFGWRWIWVFEIVLFDSINCITGIGWVWEFLKNSVLHWCSASVTIVKIIFLCSLTQKGHPCSMEHTISLTWKAACGCSGKAGCFWGKTEMKLERALLSRNGVGRQCQGTVIRDTHSPDRHTLLSVFLLSFTFPAAASHFSSARPHSYIHLWGFWPSHDKN